MKKSEWERLAHHLWEHSIKLEGGKMSLLLKELVIKCNNYMEMFLNDGGEIKIIPQGVSKEMIRLKKSVTHPGRVTYEEENKFNYDSAYHATK